MSRAACAARRSSSVRIALASERSRSSLRDIAESDLRASEAGEELKEPKPPPLFFDAPLSLLLDALDADRLLKEPKPPPFDGEDEDDERCDEKPLLKDEEPEGLASAGMAATDRARLSASAAGAYFGAYFESVFSMVRSAVES